MAHVERSVVIHAPPEQVYDLLLDTTRFGEWVAGYGGLIEGPEQATTGATYRWRFRRWQLRIRPRSTVSEIETSRRVEERLAGVVRGTLIKTLIPQKRRTQLRWEFDYRLPAGPLGTVADWLVARRVARWAVEESLRGAKRVLEAPRSGAARGTAKRRAGPR